MKNQNSLFASFRYHGAKEFRSRQDHCWSLLAQPIKYDSGSIHTAPGTDVISVWCHTCPLFQPCWSAVPFRITWSRANSWGPTCQYGSRREGEAVIISLAPLGPSRPSSFILPWVWRFNVPPPGRIRFRAIMLIAPQRNSAPFRKGTMQEGVNPCNKFIFTEEWHEKKNTLSLCVVYSSKTLET